MAIPPSRLLHIRYGIHWERSETPISFIHNKCYSRRLRGCRTIQKLFFGTPCSSPLPTTKQLHSLYSMSSLTRRFLDGRLTKVLKRYRAHRVPLCEAHKCRTENFENLCSANVLFSSRSTARTERGMLDCLLVRSTGAKFIRDELEDDGNHVLKWSVSAS